MNKYVDLARKSIEWYLNKGEYLPEMEINKIVGDDKGFNDKKGVFVTITIDGKLRGCIGNIEGIDTVRKLIVKNAVESAVGDPRFTPLSEEELKTSKIEVSILSNPEKFGYKNVDELLKYLEEKRPGLIIKYLGRTATFLPSVWEEISSAQEFLSHLCVKAGLDPEIWENEKLEMEIYFAEKHEES